MDQGQRMASGEHNTHRLIYFPQTMGFTDTTSGEARALLESASITYPFGWLFLFGSRNVWEPGESVKERGGAAADRDPMVIPMETALVRLEEASRTLRGDPSLSAVLAPLELLERTLTAQGSRGQLRLMSPPLKAGRGAPDSTDRRRFFMEKVAMAENLVYHFSAGRSKALEMARRGLKDACDFVPTGDPKQDIHHIRKAIRNLPGNPGIEEGLVRLIIGWPVSRSLGGDFGALAPRLLHEVRQLAESTPELKKPWWAFFRK